MVPVHWAVNKEVIFLHFLHQPRRHQGWWCVLSEATDGVAASSSTAGSTPAATQHRTWRGGSVFWGEGWLWLLQIELVIRLCPWAVVLPSGFFGGRPDGDVLLRAYCRCYQLTRTMASKHPSLSTSLQVGTLRYSFFQGPHSHPLSWLISLPQKHWHLFFHCSGNFI